MAEDPTDVATEPTEPPGKLRTWWHPLLVNLLRHEPGESCDVLDEVSVGQLPLRLDVVLIRKGQKRLPQAAREHLAAIADRLNRFTLLELKSPHRFAQPHASGQIAGVCASVSLAADETGQRCRHDLDRPRPQPDKAVRK